MNFVPCGKISDSDNEFLKNTALRETGEEANVWMSETEYKESNRYFTHSNCRIYVIRKLFDKKEVPSHVRFKEIRGSRWVNKIKFEEIIKLEAKIMKSVFEGDLSELDEDRIDEDEAYEAYRTMKQSEDDYIDRKKKIIGVENYDKQIKLYEASLKDLS